MSLHKTRRTRTPCGSPRSGTTRAVTPRRSTSPRFKAPSGRRGRSLPDSVIGRSRDRLEASASARCGGDCGLVFAWSRVCRRHDILRTTVPGIPYRTARNLRVGWTVLWRKGSMRHSHLMTLMSLAMCGLAIRAAAQDTKKPPPTEFNADVGFVNVSGNTSVTTFNGNERFIRRVAPWEFKQDFGSVYGKTAGTESSNLWRASLRADYAFATHWALYALTAFDRDKFAGIDSRFAEGAGVVAKLIATN